MNITNIKWLGMLLSLVSRVAQRPTSPEALGWLAVACG